MAGAGKRQGEDYDVVPSLMDVLKDALESKNRKAKHVGYHIDRDKKTIERYLNRGHFPTGADMDHVVSAVAIETGVDRFELWEEAIQAAKENVKKIGLDPRQEALEAARAVPPPSSD